MPDLKRLTAAQRRNFTYMARAMERLEWDLHNTIELTGRIPREWHEIAQRPPTPRGVKVNLRLDEDVLRFFRSMGTGYGPRINEVLRSYMHARLAGVIRGAETISPYRQREAEHTGRKPAFDDYPEPSPQRAWLQEQLQRRYAEGLPERVPPGPLVR
jgi:uncharacterized protein (DUF4415 family)